MPAVLNDLERDILDYMVRYLRAHTYQPSIREIGEAFGIRSTKTVSEHLSVLADKGYLERDPSRSRGVRILGVDLNPAIVSYPLYESIPDPSRGFESDGVRNWVSLDRRFGMAKGAYLLSVTGERWEKLGFRRGDVLMVEPADVDALGDGDFAIVGVGGVPDLYRVRRGGGFHLEGVGGNGVPLTVEDPARLVVGGKVAGYHRRLDDARMPASPSAH